MVMDVVMEMDAKMAMVTMDVEMDVEMAMVTEAWGMEMVMVIEATIIDVEMTKMMMQGVFHHWMVKCVGKYLKW